MRWVAVSSPSAEFLHESGLADEDATAVVPSPVAFSKVAERRPTNPDTAAYLGGSAPYKGYFVVADVVKALQPKHLRWLVVAGPLAHAADGPDPATALLRSMQGPDVEISGWLSNVDDA